MAYNKHNKLKRWKYIAEVYMKEKQEDIPDTFIVANVFPKYKIFISLRTWMTIKGMKPSEFETGQTEMFEDPNQTSMFPEDS